jgi:hypothetical protein
MFDPLRAGDFFRYLSIVFVVLINVCCLDRPQS